MSDAIKSLQDGAIIRVGDEQWIRETRRIAMTLGDPEMQFALFRTASLAEEHISQRDGFEMEPDVISIRPPK